MISYIFKKVKQLDGVVYTLMFSKTVKLKTATMENIKDFDTEQCARPLMRLTTKEVNRKG